MIVAQPWFHRWLIHPAAFGIHLYLLAMIEPAAFQQSFGAGVEQLEKLYEAKLVTIARLMEIATAGTIDPTPSLYNQTMYFMAALLTIALIANDLMRPVHHGHHMTEDRVEKCLTGHQLQELLFRYRS